MDLVRDAPQTSTLAQGDRLGLAWLVGLIALAVASDFFMVLALVCIPAQPLVYVPLMLSTLGCTLAQGCLLATWLAWGCEPFWQRFRCHWIIAGVLYLVWVAGVALGQPDQFYRVCLIVGLLVPLMSLAAQLPPWIARYMLGWRLARGDDGDGQPPGPLSIRNLMSATAVVAVSFASARLAPSPDDKPVVMLWVIMFAAAAVISAMTIVPVSPLLLRMQRFQIGALLAGLYAAFWIGLLWLVVLIGRHSGLLRPPPLPIVIGLSLLIASFASTVILAAAVARQRGYRLVSGWRV
jgi:hypothetical protein